MPGRLRLRTERRHRPWSGELPARLQPPILPPAALFGAGLACRVAGRGVAKARLDQPACRLIEQRAAATAGDGASTGTAIAADGEANGGAALDLLSACVLGIVSVADRAGDQPRGASAAGALACAATAGTVACTACPGASAGIARAAAGGVAIGRRCGGNHRRGWRDDDRGGRDHGRGRGAPGGGCRRSRRTRRRPKPPRTRLWERGRRREGKGSE